MLKLLNSLSKKSYHSIHATANQECLSNLGCLSIIGFYEMRVHTEEWRRFIPGIRMYKGKKTLFYNGEILWEGRDAFGENPLIYDRKERQSWQVIIILSGVQAIPPNSFYYCFNVEKVIMADTVTFIANEAFYYCTSLSYVHLSRNLRFIDTAAFRYCESLTSIFIPLSCIQIGSEAFRACKKLIILSVPNTTRLVEPNVIEKTALIDKLPKGMQITSFNLNSINQGEEFALHRACYSFNPLEYPMEDIIYEIVKRQGISSFKKPNSIGITPSQYLQENPYTEIEERKIINRYVLDMMGENVV